MKRIRVTIPIVLLVVLLTALTFSIAGCSSQQPQINKTEDKAQAYFPISKGSSWQYRGEGNEYAAFTRTVLFSENHRAQFKEDNGGTVSMSIYTSSDAQIKRVFIRGESYENKNLLSEKDNDATILLKMPLKAGNSWASTKDKREIMELDATVATPAGKFDHCIKVKISPVPSSSAAITYEYYAKDVGLVKREFISGKDKISSTLEKYQIE